MNGKEIGKHRRFAVVFALGMVFIGAQNAYSENRFADAKEGTVTDSKSGLTWVKNADCWGALTWEDASKAVEALNSGKKSCDGLTDTKGGWRLPSKEELVTLAGTEADAGLILPKGHPFEKVQQGHYWSSTAGEPENTAWYMNMHNGHTDLYGKASPYFVWPVRGKLTK
ncbi:MAG: DUF1566 domain-containing protein [Magnetococcales bacterium]|nr:DUF1566 domain-containing protein [Magnetococcales bacterium]